MTHAVSRHAALTSLALAIAAPAAFAQATPDTFDPIVVTASRYPQHLSEVLSDTQTISSEDIARSGAGTLIDLLQKQRGIEVNRSGGPGTNSSVFIRGANSNQNIVLVDGVRIGSATSGAANWSALPLSSIDHVEIVYGPLSTMYGADAVGGVIQIFTKKGDGATRFSAFAGYGRYNTRQAEASVAGSTGGNNSFSYALTAGKEKSDGFSASKLGASTYTYNPDKDGYDKESVSGQFGYQMAKGHDVGLVFLNSKLDAQFDAGLNFDARNYNKQESISVFTKNQFLPNWTSELRYAQAKDKQTSVSATGAFGRSQFDTKQTDISWQNDILIGRDTLQLLGEYRDEDVVSSAKGLSGGRNQNLSQHRTTWCAALTWPVSAAVTTTARRLVRTTRVVSPMAIVSAMPCAPTPAMAPVSAHRPSMISTTLILASPRTSQKKAAMLKLDCTTTTASRN